MDVTCSDGNWFSCVHGDCVNGTCVCNSDGAHDKVFGHFQNCGVHKAVASWLMLIGACLNYLVCFVLVLYKWKEGKKKKGDVANLLDSSIFYSMVVGSAMIYMPRNDFQSDVVWMALYAGVIVGACLWVGFLASISFTQTAVTPNAIVEARRLRFIFVYVVPIGGLIMSILTIAGGVVSGNDERKLNVVIMSNISFVQFIAMYWFYKCDTSLSLFLQILREFSTEQLESLYVRLQKAKKMLRVAFIVYISTVSVAILVFLVTETVPFQYLLFVLILGFIMPLESVITLTIIKPTKPSDGGGTAGASRGRRKFNASAQNNHTAKVSCTTMSGEEIENSSVQESSQGPTRSNFSPP